MLFGARSLRLSSVGHPFLLPGQGVNFRRPERKSCLAWQLPSVSLPTMQRYEYFMAFANYLPKNCCFFTLFRSQFCRENPCHDYGNVTLISDVLTSDVLTIRCFLKIQRQIFNNIYIIYYIYIIKFITYNSFSYQPLFISFTSLFLSQFLTTKIHLNVRSQNVRMSDFLKWQ